MTLRDFHDLRSRPCKPAEPWFSTRLNDWVRLSDGTLGKVVLQTLKSVRLVLLGGSQRTLTATDCFAQSPRLLSDGFRLTVPFGIDYQHQASITQDIPAQLTSASHHAWRREGDGQYLIHLSVEFAEAGALSLDLHVLADFSGDAAPRHDLRPCPMS